MLNVKLNYLRLLNEEICRLEGIREQMAKSRDPEKKKGYYDDLAWCRKEKAHLLCEELLKKVIVPLSEEEMAMARSFYYDGKKWEDAFYEVLDTLTSTKLELYSKNEKNHMDRLKKSIIRKIQQCTKYYRKGKES